MALETQITNTPMRHGRSLEYLADARKLIPSGVSSLMRVMTPYPIVASHASGSRLWDIDGNCYIDYLLGFGALINGHSHPQIVEAITRQAEKLLLAGTPLELEYEVARKIARMVPNAERVLFTTSGTEATMEAIRIARAVTGKTKIVKFEGAYHGHHDYVLWNVDSYSPGLETNPYHLPGYPGIPPVVSRTVLIAPWNQPDIVRRIVRRNRSSVAAIIAEPIMANCGVIMPREGFLKELREIADEYEALLIFDEVLTGFRIAPGGAQEYFGVKPHLATFGKALGGGVPIAAITGDAEILDNVAPGRIGFGGTYNAHPLALAGAAANLDLLMRNEYEAFRKLYEVGERLIEGLREAIEDSRIPAVVQGLGPLFQVFFTELPEITNCRQTVEG
ncbi:MAG: aspartate aminotransferase family protein, partial [Nitrososphaerota archaeon]